MNILITGGCGFIGSNFIHLYYNHECIDRMVCYDKLTYAGNVSNISNPLDNNFKFIKGDINDTELLIKTLRDYQITHIVNFAAESHVDRSITGAKLFCDTNVLGTCSVLYAALQTNISKMVQIGTDEVYGSLKLEDMPSVETDLLKPRSPYSASKASSDLLALSFVKTYGLNVSVTRSSNNYGAYQYPEKLIPLFVTNLLEGKKVPLMGDGSNIRDWLFVKDNCRGIWEVLNNGISGEIYNIGGNNERTNKEITLKILNLMGYNEDMIQVIEHRKGHDFRYSLDSSKINKEFNWKPKKNFDEGLEETVMWYKNNFNWWKSLKK